jgi:hypothetical protein
MDAAAICEALDLPADELADIFLEAAERELLAIAERADRLRVEHLNRATHLLLIVGELEAEWDRETPDGLVDEGASAAVTTELSREANPTDATEGGGAGVDTESTALA